MRDSTSRPSGAPRRLGFAVVRGRSMQPTLYDGDRLLVVHGVPPRTGGLAVVRLPDGVVAVKRATRREVDGWWVERDNPREGADSWSLGTIPDEAVVARVLVRVWPLVRGLSRPPHWG